MDQENSKTPKIGAHVSAAGGIFNAPKRASDLGCETFQIFSRSPQGGPAPVLTEQVVTDFKEEMKRYKIDSFVIHAPYYINLASLKNNVRYGSIKVLRDELERGSLLGAAFMMTHLGSYNDMTLEQGIEKCISGIEKILKGYEGSTQFLIEISAGAGNVLGDTFKEIGQVVSAVKNLKGFGGICFDTCHAFASGYDLRTPESVKKVLGEFDKEVGLKFLRLTHVNDSMFEIGGKRDRHQHIGKGFIGEEGMKSILTTKEFMGINWILETEDVDREEDVKMLKKIRGF